MFQSRIAGRQVRLMMCVAALALSAALAIAATAGAPLAGAAALQRHCGFIGGEGITANHIVAEHVGCATARRVANRVGKVRARPFDGCVSATAARLELTTPCVRYGYRCVTRERVSDTDLVIACTHRRALIRFHLS